MPVPSSGAQGETGLRWGHGKVREAPPVMAGRRQAAAGGGH